MKNVLNGDDSLNITIINDKLFSPSIFLILLFKLSIIASLLF